MGDVPESDTGEASRRPPHRGRFAVQLGPVAGTLGPMIRIALERIEALELLGMTLAHLSDAEGRGEVSARVPLLMGIRDKLAVALREDP